MVRNSTIKQYVEELIMESMIIDDIDSYIDKKSFFVVGGNRVVTREEARQLDQETRDKLSETIGGLDADLREKVKRELVKINKQASDKLEKSARKSRLEKIVSSTNRLLYFIKKEEQETEPNC